MWASFHKEDEKEEDDASQKEEELLDSHLSIFNLRGGEVVTYNNDR